MKLHGRLLTIAFALAITPAAALAESNAHAANVDDTLTWTFIQLSKPRIQTPLRGDTMKSMFISADPAAGTSMGLYLGPADKSPHTAANWETIHGIASSVRYGVYLINRF